MSTFLVTIETDEDGVFVASCPGLPGCHTQGADFDEALKNIKDAIEIYIEHMTADEHEPDGSISVQLVEVPVTV
ncbi:MAG: type II toxin-antitoxin system HicB family antitoxin [Chloroflexi bacterium]|nr:type II toxin-antitoxin system HicB family antitoxin [Chloroflexota bacterium]